ncbi:MAG TPA: DNA mismatch repair endonuclease MutL [Gemmatimonadaceae bacterium]|nr:DNA mismatch repair endonuclease MutL [Gemmatimonadaceae bacterium]
MPRIAVLPDPVVDQIAAGEVIERPGSVVKELVENALDAAATTIDVAVEEGGRARIRVADDGQGMEGDDARLALARHATSKIHDTDDLVGVVSFGFRGEALPAIASVSELELHTAAADGAGTTIRVRAGEIVEVSEGARRRGTTVTVSRLFFNAPVRQRFLRSPRGEWRAMVEMLTGLALMRRDVRFTVTHDGRPSLTLPPAPSLRARVAALWGGALASRLLDVDDVSGEVMVSGLVERPADVGAAARRVFLSVNGRAVRDPGLVRAAESAYRSTVPSGARPTILLDLLVPSDAVDVNVHPTKAEVRFHDRWAIERAVEDAVRRALGGTASAAPLRTRWWRGALPAAGVSAPTNAPPPDDPGWFGHRVLSVSPQELPGAAGASAGGAPRTERGSTEESGEGTAALPGEPEAAARASALDIVPGVFIPPLVQLRRTFIMFESDEGMVLIDQHSAHERVLYERFLTTLEQGDAGSQRLLLPLTLHLAPAEADAFEAHREVLERLGFEIEGFGGHTLIVRSVPLPHPRFDAERCLRETLASLAGDRHAAAASRHERLAATVACKAAIKAGDALAPAEMRALYVALVRTTLPAHDVHGRATIVHVPWDEVERRFGRR